MIPDIANNHSTLSGHRFLDQKKSIVLNMRSSLSYFFLLFLKIVEYHIIFQTNFVQKCLTRKKKINKKKYLFFSFLCYRMT